MTGLEGAVVSEDNRSCMPYLAYRASLSFALSGILLKKPYDASHPNSPCPPQSDLGVRETSRVSSFSLLYIKSLISCPVFTSTYFANSSRFLNAISLVPNTKSLYGYRPA
jgi:hypothetical protein